jgi:hypothetical protein
MSPLPETPEPEYVDGEHNYFAQGSLTKEDATYVQNLLAWEAEYAAQSAEEPRRGAGTSEPASSGGGATFLLENFLQQRGPNRSAENAVSYHEMEWWADPSAGGGYVPDSTPTAWAPRAAAEYASSGGGTGVGM